MAKEAVGTPYDTVSGIIAYESGEFTTDEEVIELFQNLLTSGQLAGLQGSYQRTARDLLNAGLIHHVQPELPVEREAVVVSIEEKMKRVTSGEDRMPAFWAAVICFILNIEQPTQNKVYNVYTTSDNFLVVNGTNVHSVGVLHRTWQALHTLLEFTPEEREYITRRCKVFAVPFSAQLYPNEF